MKSKFNLAIAFALTFGSAAYAVGGQSASASDEAIATGGASTAAAFRQWDMNNDGFIDNTDMEAMHAHMTKMDKNEDNKVSENEYTSFATGSMNE
jgi:hypothetical protein